MDIRVLIVEDNEDQAESLRRVLMARTDVKYEVEIARTLAAGLTRIFTGGIDAVVLDLQLPDGKGTDVVQRTRQADKLVGILALTGSSGPEVEAPIKAAGADGFMVKPADPTAVSENIQHIVIRKRHAQDVKENDAPFAKLDEILKGLHQADPKTAEITEPQAKIILEEIEKLPKKTAAAVVEQLKEETPQTR